MTNLDAIMLNARMAQKEFEKFDQVQVDNIVRDIGKVVFDNADLLAKIAVEETEMGVYEDKILKNRGKSLTIWNSLRGKRSVDIIEIDENKGLMYVAKPVGVVGAVTPCTNPIVTPMCNAMFALKGRNSLVIAPHPRAAKCGKYVVELFNQAISKYGAPANLIQIIEKPTLDLTNNLMRAVDVLIATGGMGMVKAAYSSGKPALGVGAGNVQCIIDRDVDIKDAVPKIIAGRIFDNGIICSGEQSVLIPADKYSEIIREFKSNGAYYVEDAAERDLFRKVLFEHGIMSKYVVGQPVNRIAQLAGVEIPEDTKVIVIKVDDRNDILCKEKMCPVMIAMPYSSFQEAVEIANSNLEQEGKGHSCAIHSNNRDNIEYAGIKLPISRLVVNQACSTSAGGSFFNGLAPTTTLGCGSWGNNSISENLDYKHLINISRVALFLKDATTPAADEIWQVVSQEKSVAS